MTTTCIIRFRRFTVKYIGATNFKPSRIRITDDRYDNSKTFSYDSEFNSADEQAIAYLKSIGISVDAMSLGRNDCHLLSEDFETPLK